MATSTDTGATVLAHLNNDGPIKATTTTSSMTSSASSPLTTTSEVDGSEIEDYLTPLKKVKFESEESSVECLIMPETPTASVAPASTSSASSSPLIKESSSLATCPNIVIIQNCTEKTPTKSSSAAKVSQPQQTHEIYTSTKTTTNTTTTKLAYFRPEPLIANNSKPLISPTKPLVINHSSASLPQPPPVANSTRINDSSTISIIPTLTTQLIFSSIISTQAKTVANLQTSTNTITTTSAIKSPIKTPASAAASAAAQHRTASNVQRNTIGLVSTALSAAATNVNRAACGSGVTNSFVTPTTTTTTTTTTNTTTSAAANSPQGTQVSARLMDLGKRLLEAAREGNTDHVRHLVINSGAPFTSDWLGTTALHLAAQNGHTEIAEILLRGGVNRDARTKLERTALHLAAQNGWHEVVDLLLIHGSDANVRDMLKMTPLHWAVERGHLLVVEKLLFNGADVHARSKFQLTPIDIAQKSQSYEMMELFRNWTKSSVREEDNNLGIYNELANNFCESQATLLNADDAYQVDYHHSHLNLNLNQHYQHQHNHHHSDQLSNNLMATSVGGATSVAATVANSMATTSRAPILDMNEPCIDLVELEWNTLKLEPDFFLPNDEEDEPKVEYLMKVVEELQKENRQLRQKVEQLSTSP